MRHWYKKRENQSMITWKLTKRQLEVLTFIASEIERKGIPPSFKDISRELGIRSLSEVSRYIHLLIEKGFLRELNFHTKRGLSLTDHMIFLFPKNQKKG